MSDSSVNIMFDSAYTANEVAFQLRLEAEGHNIKINIIDLDMAAVCAAAALVGGESCKEGAYSSLGLLYDWNDFSCPVFFRSTEEDLKEELEYWLSYCD